MRKSKDQYFMDIAEVVSQQATCAKRQVGAIIVKNNNLVSSGYNGAPKRLSHCIDDGCLPDENGKCLRCIHAEVNAIIHTSPEAREGATMYVTCEPCDKCQLFASVDNNLDDYFFELDTDLNINRLTKGFQDEKLDNASIILTYVSV